MADLPTIVTLSRGMEYAICPLLGEVSAVKEKGMAANSDKVTVAAAARTETGHVRVGA